MGEMQSWQVKINKLELLHKMLLILRMDKIEAIFAHFKKSQFAQVRGEAM